MMHICHCKMKQGENYVLKEKTILITRIQIILCLGIWKEKYI
ncbi:hypothetical protein FHS14_006446 [Paenibacillus baekrokdamisoli]|nr:hypothetical protein [Paenibacillus baekrokdamisoli]